MTIQKKVTEEYLPGVFFTMLFTVAFRLFIYLFYFFHTGTINLIVAMAILGVAVKSFRNFGKGLAQHCKCSFDFPCAVVVAFEQLKLKNLKHVSIQIMSWIAFN